MPLVAKKQWWRRLHLAWRDEALQAHAAMKKQLATLATKYKKANRARTKIQIKNSVDNKRNEIAELMAVDASFVAFLRTQGIAAKEIG
jgi:hypothetical protein